MEIKLKLNGRAITALVEADTVLLELFARKRLLECEARL